MMRDQQSDPLVKVSNVAIADAPGAGYGPFDVSEWWGVALQFIAATDPLKIRLQWLMSETVPHFETIQRAYIARANVNPLYIVTPHLATQLTIFIEGAGGSNGIYAVSAWNTERRPDGPGQLYAPFAGFSTDNGILYSAAETIAAATTVTNYFDSYVGRAHVWTELSGLCYLNVEGVELDGTVRRLRQFGPGYGNFAGDLNLPGLRLRAQLVNLAGVPNVIRASIVPERG